jgi:hypothetical protein
VTARRWAVVVASFGATIAISTWILWTGWARAGPPPTIVLWAHALALATVLLEIASRTVKVHWSAAALRVPLRFGAALRLCLGGDFAACVTPARSGAEPARFLILTEAGVAAANALLVLFTELLLETWALVLLCCALWLAFGGAGTVLGVTTAMVGLYAAGVLAAGALGYSLAHRSAHGPPPAWARRAGLHAGRWRVVQRALRSLRSSLDALRHARVQPMVLAFLASLLHVVLRLSVLPIVALAMDPSLPLAQLVLWPLVLLYGGAAVPAPGGGGAVEFAFKFAFGDVMSPAVLGGALVWWRFYSFYLYVILGGLAAGATVSRALGPPRHGRLHERAAARLARGRESCESA